MNGGMNGIVIWLFVLISWPQSWREGPGCIGGDRALTPHGLQPISLFLLDNWLHWGCLEQGSCQPQRLRLARESPGGGVLVACPLVQGRSPLLHWDLVSCCKFLPCCLWPFKFGVLWEYLGWWSIWCLLHFSELLLPHLQNRILRTALEICVH